MDRKGVCFGKDLGVRCSSYLEQMKRGKFLSCSIPVSRWVITWINASQRTQAQFQEWFYHLICLFEVNWANARQHSYKSEESSYLCYTLFASSVFSLSTRSQTKGYIMNTTCQHKGRAWATAGPMVPGANAVLSVVEVRTYHSMLTPHGV